MLRQPRITTAGVLALVLLVTTPGRAADERTPEQKRVDAAITAALEVLAEHQQASGAWRLGVAPDFHRRRLGGQESTAATSLAVMAFLAAGHVPGEGPYGPRIERGVRWVIARQHDRPDGLLAVRNGHGAMYEHGISTLMLAEVVGMMDETSARPVRQALERAVRLILKSQSVRKSHSHKGGWRYTPTSADSDISVTGWQLLALRAAKDVGCDVPAEQIDDAIAYVKRCSVRGNRGFSYQAAGNGGASTTRSGTGILCLEVCGEHHAEQSRGAAEFVLERPLRPNDTWFYYGAYYCSVGMFKMGGRFWEGTRDQLVPTLLDAQLPDGSWFKQRGGEVRGGLVYCTSMAVLALAVEYQYLPIYQR